MASEHFYVYATLSQTLNFAHAVTSELSSLVSRHTLPDGRGQDHPPPPVVVVGRLAATASQF